MTRFTGIKQWYLPLLAPVLGALQAHPGIVATGYQQRGEGQGAAQLLIGDLEVGRIGRGDNQ